jgi:hypothetical protein
LTTNARWFQLFRFEKDYIVNERGKVVEVQGATDSEGANVGVSSKNGGLNQ